ncbi:MAG: hypothetical protein H6557_20610 [Lewinellaceae bacterium]|nr:hypothetical protein [Phaeodactylibacter sp.]MCB9039022.1 hypothetical protein [Lewinellaceae bacterium]
MDNDIILKWLLQGDVSIQYQVCRDLLSQDRPELRQRIEQEGWGALLLAKRNDNGHWGRGFYQPKWISVGGKTEPLEYAAGAAGVEVYG